MRYGLSLGGKRWWREHSWPRGSWTEVQGGGRAEHSVELQRAETGRSGRYSGLQRSAGPDHEGFCVLC